VDIPTNSPATDTTAAKAGHQTRRHRGFGTPLPRWVRILVASVMLTTGAAGLVTQDLFMRWEMQARLQVDATRVAIAGAVLLPGAPERAALAAAHSAALCGLTRSEVVHAGSASDRMSFEVTLHRTAPLLVLRLFGLSGLSVTATARVHPHAPRRRADGSMVLSGLDAFAPRFNALDAALSKAASIKAASRPIAVVRPKRLSPHPVLRWQAT